MTEIPEPKPVKTEENSPLAADAAALPSAGVQNHLPPPAGAAIPEPQPVASRCVGNYHLNNGGYCIGCDRSTAEINRWDHMPEGQRKQVLEHLALRRARRDRGNYEL